MFNPAENFRKQFERPVHNTALERTQTSYKEQENSTQEMSSDDRNEAISEILAKWTIMQQAGNIDAEGDFVENMIMQIHQGNMTKAEAHAKFDKMSAGRSEGGNSAERM